MPKLRYCQFAGAENSPIKAVTRTLRLTTDIITYTRRNKTFLKGWRTDRRNKQRKIRHRLRHSVWHSHQSREQSQPATAANSQLNPVKRINTWLYSSASAFTSSNELTLAHLNIGHAHTRDSRYQRIFMTFIKTCSTTHVVYRLFHNKTAQMKATNCQNIVPILDTCTVFTVSVFFFFFEPLVRPRRTHLPGDLKAVKSICTSAT